MRRFSKGLVSTLRVVNPPAVKHGGGVINQLSSIGQDSNWSKQESPVSAKHSRDAGKQEKTGGCSVCDSSLMASALASAAEKPGQASTSWSTFVGEVPREHEHPDGITFGAQKKKRGYYKLMFTFLSSFR